jgi:hypothetical protein
MNQTDKKDKWVNETGMEIPFNYITPSDRVKERVTASLLRRSKSIHDRLAEFKADAERLCNQVLAKRLEELNAKGKTIGKGNFIFYNYDRSIKVEIAISERIDFDDITIQACKAKLDEFLNENLDAKTEFLKELVTDAFSTSRGKLDSRKVLSLMKWRTKIKDDKFHQALDLLTESIRRPGSKTYFRVSERDKNGEYKGIDLNFTSI